MIYPRNILSSLRQHMKQPQVTVITGMRRTGKTTLIQQLLEELPSKNKIYLDLQLLSNQDLFSVRNYDHILLTLQQRGLSFEKPATIAIDEIQLVKNLPSILKYLYDRYRIKFIVTGSSSYYMKNLFSESLAGRKKVFELFPLDFGEFLNFKQISFLPFDPQSGSFDESEYERLHALYEEFIEFGGFPEVVLAQTLQQKEDLLQDILSSYLSIDIATFADFEQRRMITNLMKMMASRIGGKLDASKLSRLTGISRVTVQNYINLLMDTYLLFRVPVYTKNPDREIVKAQKVYFCDNGLLRQLADVGGGVKFENAVFHQLRRWGSIQYYSLKSGDEIDFVLDQESGFEVKEQPTSSDLQTVKNLAQKAGLRKSGLICRHRSPTFSAYLWGGSIR